jgi:hypothetical protein
VFLVYGDPKRLRTAEISNWNGKAIAAPRTELDQLLGRPEAEQSGVYILTGVSPDSGEPVAYIGEAEVLKERIPAHRSRDFWVQVVAFVSKDENLTKSHIRFLEGELIRKTRDASRYKLMNGQTSGARLPESDAADMSVYLDKMQQLLPLLGLDIVTPIVDPAATEPSASHLTTTIKGLSAHGTRTPNGFVVFRDSQAVLEERGSAASQHPSVVDHRQRLLAEGALQQVDDYLKFTRDVEFTSPSLAAAVVHGGGVNGLIQWKDSGGRTLKEIEQE